jgi:hypothetical protein
LPEYKFKIKAMLASYDYHIIVDYQISSVANQAPIKVSPPPTSVTVAMQGVLTITLAVSDPEGHNIIVSLTNAPSYVTSSLNWVLIKPVLSTDFGR